MKEVSKCGHETKFIASCQQYEGFECCACCKKNNSECEYSLVPKEVIV